MEENIALPFARLERADYPSDAPHVLLRLIDGLGFRFRWATEQLTPADYDYYPPQTARNISDVVMHIFDLVQMARGTFMGDEAVMNRPEQVLEVRMDVIFHLHELRTHLAGMSEKDLADCQFERGQHAFAYFYMINGPLADALTHVGQILSWRRMNGNPISSPVNWFIGKA